MNVVKVNGKRFNLVFGKTLKEWEEKYSSESCWDFPIEELLDGTVEVNEDIEYWLIEGRCYEVF